MWKSKKLFAGILSAFMFMSAYIIPAGAAKRGAELAITPRFVTISDYKALAEVDGGEINIAAKLNSYDSVDLSIDVTVKRNGRTVDSFSASKRGTSLSLSETTDYDSDYDYKVVFEFDAGGETYTVTETV